jgi:hypothetical protein
MKITKTFFLIIPFVIGILATGCQTSIYTLTNEEKTYPHTDMSKINVTTMDKVDKGYQEVGYIFAFGSSLDDAVINLKKQASEFGSNEVIKLQVMVLRRFFLFIPIDDYFCAGIAIKYQ